MNPEALVERARIRQEVKGCTRCALVQRCSGPVPFSGPSSPKLVVVGEAPGKVEDEQGEPFVGPAGSLVREWLDGVGYDVLQEVVFVNAVSCFPDRTPTKSEVEACSPNLLSQLSHVDCRFLLVLGGVALQALCHHEVRIGEARGIWWRPSRVTLPRPTWALATWHPAAVLRNRALAIEATGDVEYQKQIVDRGAWDDFWQDDLEGLGRGSFCVKCGSPDVDYYNDFPYCARHKLRVVK